MGKGYVVSGVKNGKQRAWAFSNLEKAEEMYNKIKFQRGWRDLGVSERPSFEQAKKEAKFAHNSTPA